LINYDLALEVPAVKPHPPAQILKPTNDNQFGIGSN